jgi:hemerythrin-like metal-binding protein
MIVWKNEYLIGVEHIDVQHQSLFTKVAEFSAIVEAGVEENKDDIIAGIKFLKEYALKHFADEEAYQQSIDHPEFAEHQAQHKSFVQTVLNTERELKASDYAESDVRKLLNTLSVWLVFHVANTDQKLAIK